MAEANTFEAGTSTVLEVEKERTEESRSPTVKLKLRKPKNDKKVKWEQGTVDNEFMDKKKSKCCCVYEKQKFFMESSSDESGDDDCTKNCRGHKKKCFRHDEEEKGGPSPGDGSSGVGAS